MTAFKQALTSATRRREPGQAGSLRPGLVNHRDVDTTMPPARAPLCVCCLATHVTGIEQRDAQSSRSTSSQNRDRAGPLSATMHVWSIEERLRNWGSERRGSYDPVDAGLVDAAWRRLHVRHRDLLQMVYLWKAGREVVCRRLKIRRHPAQFFELEVAAAKAALKRILNPG
ncbi:hypothetical protein [Paraburkholderia sp. BCC1885]|uniref:hypothetical protein n=1 Tax=Paraburkholderia sp. BCC1885 TaxID=2562669 RepID=UPI0021B3144B|nr:hypothetical protein [Paraburkholderia sp. BCC1885]